MSHHSAPHYVPNKLNLDCFVRGKDWKQVARLCTQKPFLTFTNSMLRALSAGLGDPSYQGEANGLLLFLMSEKGRERNPHLRLKNNWVLWDGLVSSLPHHQHTEITKQFMLLHDFSDKSDVVGRFSQTKEARPLLEQALQESDLGPEVAAQILRRHSYREGDLVIIKACFQKLDGAHYVKSLDCLSQLRSPLKELCVHALQGGVFLHDALEVKKHLLPLVKSYAMQKDMFWLSDEVMFVVLKDLYRTQPHMFTNLFENGIPDAFQKEIFAPFVTKALIEKEMVGKGSVSLKKKM